MGKTIFEPAIGHHVYKNYQPLMAGVIVEVLGPIEITRPDQTIYVSSFYNVKVRWVNGSVSMHPTSQLSDFHALIMDTQRKLNTHLKTLAKLQKLEE